MENNVKDQSLHEKRSKERTLRLESARVTCLHLIKLETVGNKAKLIETTIKAQNKSKKGVKQQPFVPLNPF